MKRRTFLGLGPLLLGLSALDWNPIRPEPAEIRQHWKKVEFRLSDEELGFSAFWITDRERRLFAQASAADIDKQLMKDFGA